MLAILRFVALGTALPSCGAFTVDGIDYVWLSSPKVVNVGGLVNNKSNFILLKGADTSLASDVASAKRRELFLP
jgi:hypothetical protein